jgi:hypothetical protein
MAVYVLRDGVMVDKATGERMVPEGAELAAPRVWSDLPGYRSPIDGSWIEGRRARKYDLEKNNCVDANDLPGGSGKLRNAKFAEKHGLSHLLER